MSAVRILPERVSSQIAAGEVVERPSSVVRELTDNSIDAGADRIVVRLEGGGKRRITVSDNGSGMSRDDLLLCVERHATSKIETADDLLRIRSLGFRGEALPSIGSVSRMRIVTRPGDQLVGNLLRIHGGKLVAVEETGAPAGTVVDVESLFYNTPARRSFLRAVRTEANHVLEVFSRLALPFLTIAFRLEEEGKVVLDLPPSEGYPRRLAALMGKETAGALMTAETEGDRLSVRAFLSPAELSRNRGDRLYVYVNGRHIRDRLLTRALLEGYGRRLMKGQYPQAAVFVNMDPSDVDVNVHPTKQEVRFRSPQGVFGVIERLVALTLEGQPSPVTRFSPGAQGKEIRPVSRFGGRPGVADRVSDARQARWARPESQAPPVETALFPGMSRGPGPQIIGQLGDAYILCQAEDGLLVVDQHAAHERVVYETLRRGVESSRPQLQTLLVPVQVELSPKEARLALDTGGRLAPYGIELEHFGGNTFLMRAVPALLGETRWESLISELVAELDRTASDPGALRDRVLAVMACHGAVRSGHRLSREEGARLIEQLAEMDLPTHCPHGRPIFQRITYGELEKRFKRIV